MPSLKLQLSGPDSDGQWATLVFDRLVLDEAQQAMVVGSHVDYALGDGRKGQITIEGVEMAFEAD